MEQQDGKGSGAVSSSHRSNVPGQQRGEAACAPLHHAVRGPRSSGGGAWRVRSQGSSAAKRHGHRGVMAFRRLRARSHGIIVQGPGSCAAWRRVSRGVTCVFGRPRSGRVPPRAASWLPPAPLPSVGVSLGCFFFFKCCVVVVRLDGGVLYGLCGGYPCSAVCPYARAVCCTFVFWPHVMLGFV